MKFLALVVVLAIAAGVDARRQDPPAQQAAPAPPVQTVAPPGPTQTVAPPGPTQTIAPPGPTQTTAPPGPQTPAQTPDACTSGKAQSPINVNLDTVQCVRQGEAAASQFKVRRFYQPSNNLTLNGATLIAGAATVAGSYGYITLGACSPCDGQRYLFDSFRVVSPAEHTIGGKKYAAELQLRHKAENSDNVIISSIFIYQQADGGFPNKFLQSVQDFSKDPATVLDLASLREATHGEYFHYKGSDIVDGCPETATHIVYKTPAGVTKDQLAYIKSKTTYTSRAVQATNDRQVTWYRKPLF